MSIESLLLQKVLDEYVTDAQKANIAGMMVPGASILEASGQYRQPGGDELSEAFTGENYPSISENIKEGEYLDALLQGIGVAGDSTYAAGPVVGMAAGTPLKFISAVGGAMKASSKTKATTKSNKDRTSKETLKQNFIEEHPPVGSIDSKTGKPVTEQLINSRANAFEKGLSIPAVRKREELRIYNNTDPQIIAPQRNIKTPEDLLGKVLVPVVGDRSTVASQGIIDIKGVPLNQRIPLQGGPNYMIENATTGKAWASMEDAANKKQMNMILAADETGLEPYGVYSAMGRESADFSAPVVTSMIAQLPALEIPKKHIKAFNDTIRKGIGKTQEGRPDFVGLDSDEIFNQMLGTGNFDRKGAGALRKIVVEEMKKPRWQNLGFPIYDDVLKTVNEPSLMNIKTGESGFGIFKGDPSKSTFPELTHQSYDTAIPGEYFGGLKESVPPEIMFPKTFENLSQTKNVSGELLPYQQQVGSLMMNPKLYEVADDEYVDQLIKYMNKNKGTNYEKGGIVNKGIESILLKQVQRNVDRAKRTKETSMEYAPSPGQMSNFAGMLAPGAGYADFFGEYPSLPDYDQPVTEAFSNEPYPSFAENLKRGGFGGYFDASMQGLGAAGDTLYAAPYVGPPLGGLLKTMGAFGTVMRAGSKAGKATKPEEGIATLGKQPMFTPEDTLNLAYTPDGSYSPGIKDLIEKASPKLRGQGITQWANKNLKPKELEVLGIEEFIKANPKATLRETVEGISGNKVVVGKKVLGGGEGQVMDFDITRPLEDPLDGSLAYQPNIEDLKYELDEMKQSYASNELYDFDDDWLPSALKDHYNKEWDVSVDKFSDIPEGMVDEVVEDYAKAIYMQEPNEVIRPTGVNVGDNTFAYGNGEVGYQIFVDGQRKTDPGNIAYSRTEAQIKLRDEMADEGYDMFRVNADDYDPNFDGFGGGTQYKQFIDNSLPGGKNYREIIYTYEDAPEGHNIGHFSDDIDEGNYLAHALVRDRKLADGTETLHGDELQSDLHRDGAKYDYRTPEKLEEIQSQLKANTKETLKQADIVEDMLIKKGVYDKTTPDGVIQAARIEDYLKNIKDYYKLNAYDYAQVEADDFVFFLKGLAKPKDADNYNPLTDFQWTADEFELLSDFAFDTKNSKRLQSYMNDLVPNYPYKDDYHEMLIKKMVLQAIEEGKPAISVSGSAPIKARYESGNDAVDEKNFRFYENLYDKKIPSAMDKLAKKYGGEFQKSSKLDVEDTFGTNKVIGSDDPQAVIEAFEGNVLDANVIKITEEMRNKILLEGIPDFATGGIVNKGIARLRTAKKFTEGIVDLGLY